jgi:hypothetical protein
VPTPPHPDRNSRKDLGEELAEMFDRCVVGYYRSIDAEQWSDAFEYGKLIDYIHNLAERVAA